MKTIEDLKKAIEKDDHNEADAILADMDIQNPDGSLTATLIEFIADNPNLNFGLPGPVIHFIEKKGRYEEPLIRAVYQKPNWYLLFMMNRYINANDSYGDGMLEALKFTSARTDIDKDIADDAMEFYEFQLD